MPSIPRASSPSNAPSTSASPSSQWHAITPTTRPLNLEILEVTSLSLTVALTLAYPPTATASSPSRNQLHSSGSITKHRRKHRSRPTDSEDELTAVEDEFTGPLAPPYISSAFPGTYPMRLPLSPNARPSFKELLSKGVVVTVNGRPWNRIVAHVSDDEEDLTFGSGNFTSGDAEARQSTPIRRMGHDRAVVVIYGLLPGNEYQVDLKVVGNVDHEVAGASANITTANQPSAPASSQSSGNRSRANSIRKGVRSRSSSLLQTATSSNPTSAPEETLVTVDGHLAIPHPETPAPVEILQPRDSRSPEDNEINNLRHLISNVALEKEDLIGQLKRSRRESQRTEATLRSEIEALKRAIDKTTQPDQRSRQKSLALQEQVKQAWNAATEAESQHDMILNGMGGLHGAEASLREDWGKARAERDHAVEERDEAIEEDRNVMNKLDGELQTLQNKLDKQRMKKAKIAKENDELRQKLEEVASAQREVEKRNDSIRQQRMMVGDYGYGRMWDYDGAWGGRYGGMTHDTNGLHTADLQNVMRGRQVGGGGGGGGAGTYAGVRPFYPSNATASTSSSAVARAGSAAMATQGLPPRSGNALTSHLGNPIGFFPPTSSLTSSRSLRVVSREGVPGSGGSANATPASPLMANVTAAPFMPSRQPPSMDSGYGYDQQTTSLVPPQLQHRIYLPSTRSRLSPTFDHSVAGGQRLPGEEGGGETAPAFPPLPSQGSALNSSKTMPSGPSLASIVNRAIIPTGPLSVSSTSNSVVASLRSPTGSMLLEPALTDGAALRPAVSPGVSRQPSWAATSHPKATPLFTDAMDGHIQPTSAGGEEFPPLPLSPSSPWGPSASPSIGPSRQITATPPFGSGPNSSNSSSAGGWQRQGGPSRRSSLQTAPGQLGTPPL